MFQPLKLFCIAVFIAGIISCGNHKNENTKEETPVTKLVDDTTMYDFISSVLADRNAADLSSDKLVDREMLPRFLSGKDSLKLLKMKTILSAEDIDFIRKQTQGLNDFKFD